MTDIERRWRSVCCFYWKYEGDCFKYGRTKKDSADMGKRKVLFIVEAMGGGVFTYIVSLANGLVGDFDMYIAYGIRKQTPVDYKKYFDKRIHLIEVKNFQRAINPKSDIGAFFEIKRIANAVKPDIIHLHSSKAGALGRVAFNNFQIDGKSVSVFYTPHGYSFLMQNQSVAKRTIYKAIECCCGKLNCTTISCSEGEHQETLKLTKRAVYVDNGIDVGELEKNLGSLKIKNHQFTVFTLGRICFQKCPRLFNEIAEAMPDVKFLWIGDGELRQELKAKNIEITGWTERKAALTKSMTADVFILTSLWEGLPISLLEAMYMKKPCVVSDVIGNHDVIHTGENGFVCAEKQQFVEAIRIIQRDMYGQTFESKAGTASVYPKAVVKGTTSKLIKNAYKNVMTKYNTAAMSRSYAKIYGGGVQYDVIIVLSVCAWLPVEFYIATEKAVA